MKKKAPYIDFNGIKLSPRFFDAVSLEPDVTIGFDPSVPYLASYPWVFDAEGPVAPLHDCVWSFFHSSDRPKKDGKIIHHKDGDPLNATVENLGIGSRSAHALAHAMKRQRFTHRKRWRLFGFYRPRAEEPVRSLQPEVESGYRDQLLARERARAERDELRLAWLQGLKSARDGAGAAATSAAARPQRVIYPDDAADWVLAQALPRLRAELDHLDSGEKIPPPASRPRRKDRLLGIGRIRRGCTAGEAALVRLLVKFNFDITRVADDVGPSVGAIAKMMREPPVALAIQNWRRHRRLPPPCAFDKVKPYMGSRP